MGGRGEQAEHPAGCDSLDKQTKDWIALQVLGKEQEHLALVVIPYLGSLVREAPR